MDTRKLENIITLILILLNIFLLSVLLADRAETRRSRIETEAALIALLGENGIGVSGDAELVQTALPQRTVVRDQTQEKQRAGKLIGSCQTEDLGGSILFYRSEGGQMMLRGTGETDILFSAGAEKVRGNREKTALRLLQRAGLEAEPAGEQTDESVRCRCVWDGCPIYNAVLEFDFSGNNLHMVSGVMPFGTETAKTTDGVMNSVSALMRFMEIVKNEGFICSRLESLSPGYLMSVTVSGESTLTPVWCIETDTGELLLNAISGAAESAAT